MLGNAIQVLDCCRKANIQNISFATVRESNQDASISPNESEVERQIQ